MNTGLLIWLAIYAVYLRCVPATFYFEDSPEILACSLIFGNTHPPGYPLLSLLGRLAEMLPVGGPGFRFNLLTAACGAGAGALLAALTARVSNEIRPGSRRIWTLAAGLLAAGAWAFSDAFWWEAVIGDKYAPYYLLFVSVLFMGSGCLNGTGSPGRRGAVLVALGVGVCFAIHYYAVFSLPLVALVFVRFGMRAESGTNGKPLRVFLFALFMGLLPVSTRVLYPPIRSAAGVELDWGRPASAGRLVDYLAGKLYYGSFGSEAKPRASGDGVGRLELGFRLLMEEMPLPIFIGAPVGFLILLRFQPWLAGGSAACGLANWLYAGNFSEKIVRWYEPAYAILLMFSAIGLLWLFRRLGKSGLPIFLAVSALISAWQLQRGYSRCNLGGFYAAHDFSRNLLLSIPKNSIYLGSGDFDLFPLWAVRYCEGSRPDVVAIGVASFLDPRLAGAGSQMRLAARLGLPKDPAMALARLMGMSGELSLMAAPAGYDVRIYGLVPGLTIQQTRGLAGRLQKYWDAPGSFRLTRRVERAYTYRGLSYARHEGLIDLARPRDEVARGALLQYPLCFSVLAVQGFRFGMPDEGAWAFKIARSQMVALVGPLGLRVGSGSRLIPGQRDRYAVVEGFQRLAELFDGRGVFGLANQYRECARAIAE